MRQSLGIFTKNYLSMFKKLLNKLFGYRWSLYIVKNENELMYAMHENSVLRILGYIVEPFKNGEEPKDPWSLHLNFNKSHTSFKLQKSHFTKTGTNLDPKLISKIESIDPDFNKTPSAKPVFMDMKNNKKLKISDYNPNVSPEKRLANAMENVKKGNDASEPTFFSIIRKVFV